MPARKPVPSLHRRIIRDALEIAWHHKHLWVFGFFATFIGFGGVTEAFFNAFDASANAAPWSIPSMALAGALPGWVTIQTVSSYSPFPVLALAAFLIVVAVLGAVYAFATVASAGALLSGTRKIARGGEPHFSDGVKAGTEKFWPLLGVILGSQLVTWGALAITGGNLAASIRDGSLTSGLFFVGSFALGVVIAFLAALASVFGSLRVIAKNDAPGAALTHGFAVASEHWFVLAEMAVLLTGASLLVGLGVMLAALILSVPLIFLLALASTLGLQGVVVGIITLTAMMILVMAAGLGAFVTTFQASAWTLLWEELDDKPLPKVLRWIGMTVGKKKR